ncbi:endonuclease/exonuclease/phosphatase family protein [Streptomyces sp. NPDC052225]|uniref:endonuclease/exonuclease/phosphatase family protein n=1 Tax=Streptomyces sp. NPDC052225 TaxID=3154949 RepID=UPI00342BF4A3
MRPRRALRALSRPGPWKRGRVLAALAVLLGLVLLLHAHIPNGFKNLGSLVETFLPWFGVFVPVLLVAALCRRSAVAVVALLLPVVAWLSLFGGLFTTSSQTGGDLTVVSHNVGAENPDPTGTAHDLAASGADVLALEEMTPKAVVTYEKALATAYPHHAVLGTVGVWSKLPLSRTEPLDASVLQGMFGPLGERQPVDASSDSIRAIRTTVTTDKGPVAVYVAHLGSVRINPREGLSTGQRNAAAEALAKTVAEEKNERVVLAGDLNGTMDDRAFDSLTAELDSVQDEAGKGFGFTWPAAFPMVRIDQILVRGVRADSAWLLPATGSDHRPVAATISW